MPWTPDALKDHFEHEIEQLRIKLNLINENTSRFNDQRFKDILERTDIQIADAYSQTGVALHALHRELAFCSEKIAGMRSYFERVISDQTKRFEDARVADTAMNVQIHETQQAALNTALVTAEKATRAALDAAKEAVLKAEASTESRLSLLNDLRDDAATKQEMFAVEQRLSDIKERVDKNEAIIVGRSTGLHDYMGYILFAISLVGFFLMYVRK